MNVIELTLADLTSIGLEKLHTDNVKSLTFSLELMTGETISSTSDVDVHLISQKADI